MMRGFRALLVFGAAFVMTGCGDLLSLHPLCTQRDCLFDATLEGRWENDDDLLIVSRAGDGYEVTLQSRKNPSEQEKYEVHRIDIRGVRFVDILAMNGVGHMFLKIRGMEGQLRVAFFDSQWLLQRIPHEEAEVARGKKQAVLTAPTAELQKFIGKYALEPKAYDDEIAFSGPK